MRVPVVALERGCECAGPRATVPRTNFGVGPRVDAWGPAHYVRPVPAFRYEGIEYRIDNGQLEQRSAGERRWRPCSRSSLLAFEVDSPLWDWLRSHGITRPSPSGEVKESERGTVAVKLRLEPPDADRLTDLAEAEGTTKSGLVTKWIRAHK